jgi:hypothetical protein
VLPTGLVLLASLYSASATAQAPRTLAELAPNASGVALAEVVEVKPFDERPGDGNAGVRFKLKLIRGSGHFQDTVAVETAFGGLRPPGDVPKPSAPLKANSLKKGGRFWFAFASSHEWEKHNQGVIGFWPENDSIVAEILEATVKKDVLKWSPQYDPELKLSYGHIIEKDRFRVRVEKAGQVIWEQEIAGKMIGPEFAFGLTGAHGFPETIPAKLPASGRILCVKSLTNLAKDNEYELPAGKYSIEYGFDPESGKRYAVWLTLHLVKTGGIVDALHREYDPVLGKPKRDDRFEDLKSGGNRVGAKTEAWFRKVSRTFDPATGNVTSEEIYWFDKDVEFEKRWVKVKN